MDRGVRVVVERVVEKQRLCGTTYRVCTIAKTHARHGALMVDSFFFFFLFFFFLLSFLLACVPPGFPGMPWLCRAGGVQGSKQVRCGLYIALCIAIYAVTTNAVGGTHQHQQGTLSTKASDILCTLTF